MALQNVGVGIAGTVFALQLTGRGFSEAVVGDVEGALALAGAITCLLVPPLVVSAGYRRVMMLAALALGVARLGQAIAPSAALVVLLGGLFGVGDGAMQALASSFISENALHGGRLHVYTADWTTRVAASVAGFLLGGIVPDVLSPLIGETESLRLALVAAAVLAGSSAIFAARINETSRPKMSLVAAWGSMFRGFASRGRVVRLLLPQMLIALGGGLVMPFVALFLKHRLGASVAEVGLVQAGTSVAMVLAALGTPALARRFGPAGAIAISEVASLPFMALIPITTSLPLAAGLYWVRGSLMNMTWPLYNQLSMEGLPAADKPVVAGLARFGWSVAWFAGATLGGRLNELSYTTPYYVTIALYLAGALATLALLRGIVVADAAGEA